MKHPIRFILATLPTLVYTSSSVAELGDVLAIQSTQLGPRPFYLVDKLSEGMLKQQLENCASTKTNYSPSDFSIGHRGAPLQFPEHTLESYVAAARMGAGILECDVTFTNDAKLVCRHAQCDLHRTTNIVATDLRSKCTVPPELDAAGNLTNAAQIKCCTSDITLAEFKTLTGKMDAVDTTATTVEGYLGGTADFRTDLYTTGATLLTHAESIHLFQELGRKMTPELKGGDPDARDSIQEVFGSQAAYAQALINEYRDADVPARNVWVQSFDLDDVLHWIDANPDFGKQAVYLEGRDPSDLVDNPPPQSEFDGWKERGINVLAPPMPALLTNNGRELEPSTYARRAREAGLKLISWTTERSGRVNEDIVRDGGAFYYDTTVDALENDGDILRTIEALVQQVGIFGLFSDWPATTTFYANCKAIPQLRGGDRERNDGEND